MKMDAGSGTTVTPTPLYTNDREATLLKFAPSKFQMRVFASSIHPE